jgi:sporulation protein YunB
MKKIINTKKIIIRINKKNIIYLIIFTIIILTISLIINYGSSITKLAYSISEQNLNQNITTIINNNIKPEILAKYQINDLITMNYSPNGTISSVNYNINKTYLLLSTIKKNLKLKLNIENPNNNYFSKYQNNYYLKLPIFANANNILLNGISPKVYTRIDLINSINGNIYTKVKTYGINSLLIGLYISLDVNSYLYFNTKKQNIKNSYEILIASKIIEGEIPNYYNGILEDKSLPINV